MVLAVIAQVISAVKVEMLRLLVVIQGLVVAALVEFVTLSRFEVFAHHFGHQFLEGGFGRQAQLGLGRVTQQGFDFGGAELNPPTQGF